MDPTLLAGEGVSDLSPFVAYEWGKVVALSATGLGEDTLGFSPSSLRKLDFKSLVLSATEGGFSGRGGAGPLPVPDVVKGKFVLVAMLFVSSTFKVEINH